MCSVSSFVIIGLRYKFQENMGSFSIPCNFRFSLPILHEVAGATGGKVSLPSFLLQEKVLLRYERNWSACTSHTTPVCEIGRGTIYNITLIVETTVLSRLTIVTSNNLSLVHVTSASLNVQATY